MNVRNSSHVVDIFRLPLYLPCWRQIHSQIATTENQLSFASLYIGLSILLGLSESCCRVVSVRGLLPKVILFGRLKIRCRMIPNPSSPEFITVILPPAQRICALFPFPPFLILKACTDSQPYFLYPPYLSPPSPQHMLIGSTILLSPRREWVDPEPIIGCLLFPSFSDLFNKRSLLRTTSPFFPAVDASQLGFSFPPYPNHSDCYGGAVLPPHYSEDFGCFSVN